jgi:hypothetical protein
MGRSWTLALLVALACAAGCTGVGQVTLKVSHAEMQSRLDKKFPVTKRKSVLKVVFSNPRLELISQANQLQTTLTVNASALGVSLGESDVTIRGGVRYDKESKAFHMTDPRVEKLDVSHVPARYQDKLRRAVDLAVQDILPIVPVYRLNKDNFRHSAARTFLQEAWVDDNTLYLKMQL